MTKPEFIQKYRYSLGGLILFMQSDEVKAEGVLSRTQRIFDMPAQVEKILAQMYDDLKRLTPEVNGTPTPKGAR